MTPSWCEYIQGGIWLDFVASSLLLWVGEFVASSLLSLLLWVGDSW
jgi:hypothetical protein